MGVTLEMLGGLVAHQFEGVAAFKQRLTLGDEALELDRLDLGSILFALQPLLAKLVFIELAFDPIGRAMEQIDRTPQQLLEVWFKACVGHRHQESVEDVGDAGRDDPAFGKGTRVGFVLKRAVAVELQLLKDVVDG